MDNIYFGRRDFLKQAGLLALSAAAAQSVWRCKARRNRPNIILIMADDLGYGDPGCYGNGEIRTPNIDRLAKTGLRFTDYHANGAVCSPTRAALLTGRYQQRSGIEGVIYARGEARQTGLDLKERTFAKTLKAGGYKTAIFGKWHLGYNVEFNPVKQGFDEFRGYVSGNVDYHSHVDGAGIYDWWHNEEKVQEEGYVTDLIADHAVDFMKRNKDQSFCLYLAHEAPHYPYQGRNDQADRQPGGDFPNLGSREDREAAYKEMVEAMDDGVGRVVSTIEELGLSERTFVFFCSDNGATKVGSNGILNGFKGGLYEGGHRVPAIAYWPGKIKSGVDTDETVLSMDLFPTMLSIAGLPSEGDPDGIDLSPVLFKNAHLPERTLFWRYRRQKAARRGDWKLLVNDGKMMLFNLKDDLQEQHNLADKAPDRVQELLHVLEEWERRVTEGIVMRTT